MPDRMTSTDGRYVVEAIMLSRGHGPRPVLRLTGPGPVRYCRTVAELQRWVDLAALVPGG